MAVLRKAGKIEGKNLYFRDATVGDAEFILALRTNVNVSPFISHTSSKLEDQIKWMEAYALDDGQAYFIVRDKSHKPLGCVRMYDANADNYYWGSWLMIPGLPPQIALETVMLLYAYGSHLGFSNVLIESRKENFSVHRFHETLFSAERIKESADHLYFIVRERTILKNLEKYRHLLTHPLIVEQL